MAALDATRHRTLTRLLDDLVPGDDLSPGAGAAGGAEYVEGLLSAFEHDPPRIWAGGPFSGRHGGEPRFGEFLEPSGWEAHAWRTRIHGWSQQYSEGLAALGPDYGDLGEPERAARRAAASEDFLDLAFTHDVESLYGDPVYGGNRGGAGWAAIGFPGDSQPAGYTDAEVSDPWGERQGGAQGGAQGDAHGARQASSASSPGMGR